MTNIHPSSIIGENVKIGNNVYIGPNCVIGFGNYHTPLSFLLNSEQTFQEVFIGDNTKIMGNVVICQGTTIGDNNRIDYHSYLGENVKTGSFVDIKYRARIYNNVEVGNYTSISSFIADNCIVGNHCIIQGNLIHKFKDVIYGTPEPSPIVKDYAFIGMNSVVVGKVMIEERSYIGAATVITKNTKPNRLYIGNPAKEIGVAPAPFLKRRHEQEQIDNADNIRDLNKQ